MLYQMVLIGLGGLILKYLNGDNPPPAQRPPDRPQGPAARQHPTHRGSDSPQGPAPAARQPSNHRAPDSPHPQGPATRPEAPQTLTNASTSNVFTASTSNVFTASTSNGFTEDKINKGKVLEDPSSSKSGPCLTKSTLLSPIDQQTKNTYALVHESSTPTYAIPEDFKDLIKKNIVPRVLKSPLSPQIYRDFFAALLYAEDFYIEKWSDFQLLNVNLELHQAAIQNKSNKNGNRSDVKEEEKTFVAFELDTVRERRPFLLSRDFVFVRPSGSTREPFQGIIYRVVKSNRVLVEFGYDFHSQHSSSRKYDVSFSFNRVSLKRCHQAIEATSDYLLQNVIFPSDCISRPPPILSTPELDWEQNLIKSAVGEIVTLKGPPPYLIHGPMSVASRAGQLSRTGLVIGEAVLEIYRTFPKCRILITAPINSTCDVLMRNLKKQIPESNMFRANAAFRELDGVPDDILPSCRHKGDCFACPSLKELRKFKVILSTFVSSFRLSNEGLKAGHFSHIFMVDASSASEPEILVTLAHLASNQTTVVVSGAPSNHPHWVRSDIGRSNGLMVSYFERLLKADPYDSYDSNLITRL